MTNFSTADINAVASMRLLTWTPKDGPELSAHYSTADFSIEHTHAEHVYPFVDAAVHDWTGRNPIPFSVKLLFLNGLLDRDGVIEYPNNWQAWRKHLMLGHLGTLKHPDLGKFTVRVVSAKVSINSGVRSGAIVDVEFVESIDMIENQNKAQIALVSPAEAAKAADESAAVFKIAYPRGEPYTDVFGAVDSVMGQIDSYEKTVSGKINQVNGKIQKLQSYASGSQSVGAKVAHIIQTVDRMKDDLDSTDPEAWIPFQHLEQVQDALDDLKEPTDTNSGLTVKSKSTTSVTTLDEFAAQNGNSLQQIMGLNLSLLRAPTIPAGTVVKYYAS